MRKLIVPLLMLFSLGCGKAEPSAPTAKTEAPKETVVRKDGWVVIAPPPAVCVEHKGEITVTQHGTVTVIKFGPEIPDPRPQPKVPPIPPPVVPPFPPPSSPIPPSGPPYPPGTPFPPATPRVPPPEGVPDPLPLPGKLPLPGTLPLPSPGQ